MKWLLPLLLVLAVGAIVGAIHFGAMRWLARHSEPRTDADER